MFDRLQNGQPQVTKRNGPDAVLKHWLALTETRLIKETRMAVKALIPIPNRFSNTYFHGGRA
jgi:hypothetical protein